MRSRNTRIRRKQIRKMNKQLARVKFCNPQEALCRPNWVSFYNFTIYTVERRAKLLKNSRSTRMPTRSAKFLFDSRRSRIWFRCPQASLLCPLKWSARLRWQMNSRFPCKTFWNSGFVIQKCAESLTTATDSLGGGGWLRIDSFLTREVLIKDQFWVRRFSVNCPAYRNSSCCTST